ncbi:MAG: UDP-4-amino-4,6-dideoxy-N-acetyl-beta-L-altrosamine transaminase [Syntrophomonadaceae bacterium]|jgi:UDP-4-amino-4,6-dideoxy-N-acetyl-beta-L-altrosamine transaminase|nr:UDP-4-amino-4,6-dideoxy-N-acetyl-beta-L-altrosamine transaminase [Syntrophomonadaceae bacterium]
MEPLAIHGGPPTRNSILSYGRQSIDDNDIQNVVEVLKGEYLTTGPYVQLFENQIAEYVGAKYAVAVSSGTGALHMACFAAGIGKDDQVIVSPLTFAASANCILYCGGIPVFADIDPQTFNIGLHDIERKITPKTKALIPVDFAGQSVDMDAINKIARKHNLIVIEDAAHALGSSYKGNKVGNNADLTAFSFHPVKPITTGEGGVVTTNNESYYQRMLQFRAHGITRETELSLQTESSWYYEQQFLGYNYRLTDLQSALGSSQLKKIDVFISRRRYLAQIYSAAFLAMDELIVPCEADYAASGWHIYVIRLKLPLLNVSRNTVFAALRAENIGVNLHYIPVYLHPYYKRLGYEAGLCPQAEQVYQEIITLPLFPSMSDEDAQDVIKAVKKVINYYRRQK